MREIDIDPALDALLHDYRIESSDSAVRIAERSPLSAGNIRNRVLHPLLAL